MKNRVPIYRGEDSIAEAAGTPVHTNLVLNYMSDEHPAIARRIEQLEFFRQLQQHAFTSTERRRM